MATVFLALSTSIFLPWLQLWWWLWLVVIRGGGLFAVVFVVLCLLPLRWSLVVVLVLCWLVHFEVDIDTDSLQLLTSSSLLLYCSCCCGRTSPKPGSSSLPCVPEVAPRGIALYCQWPEYSLYGPDWSGYIRLCTEPRRVSADFQVSALRLRAAGYRGLKSSVAGLGLGMWF